MAGLSGRILHRRQGEGLEAARSRRGPRRDPGLQLPEAGRAAAERQEGHRRRRHREEAPADAAQKLEQQVVKLDTQARQALAAGNEELARTALERKNVAQTELQGLDRRSPSSRAQQQKLTDNEAEAAREDRGLPHQEGGHQGAVLRRRGAGADLRGGHRRRRGDGRRRPGDAARGRQDREHEGPRRRGRGARGRRHVRGHHAARRRRGRHRPPARAARRPRARSTTSWRR